MQTLKSWWAKKWLRRSVWLLLLLLVIFLIWWFRGPIGRSVAHLGNNLAGAPALQTQATAEVLPVEEASASEDGEPGEKPTPTVTPLPTALPTATPIPAPTLVPAAESEDDESFRGAAGDSPMSFEDD